MSRPTVQQLKQLVGNPMAYAVQWVAGDGYTPVREPLTNYVLHQHLAGNMTIGTYIVSDDSAKTLVFDIDVPGVLMDPALDDAMRVRSALKELGIPERCVGIEFSGSKGYHVWVVMQSWVSASSLRRLGRAALSASGVECEVFPKQSKASDLGNLVKLPYGLHRKTMVRSEMMTAWPLPVPIANLYRILEGVPEVAISTGEATPTLECMAAIQDGPTVGWRNHGLFHLATMLYRASVSSLNVRLVVEQANQRAKPAPLEPWEVDQLLASAENSGPICATLPAHVQCAECPIRRSKGLYCKPGQIRYGGEGELAVIELGKRRKGGELELIHPDLSFGLVSTKANTRSP